MSAVGAQTQTRWGQRLCPRQRLSGGGWVVPVPIDRAQQPKPGWGPECRVPREESLGVQITQEEASA